MKKLSKAQQEVMDHAKRKIDKARSMDYPTWLKASDSYYDYHEKQWKKAVEEGYLKEYWEDARNGIVLTHCNSKTLWKLEEFGLIEIIEDSTGDRCGIDTVKVLNY
jgi:hypothetical protein